MSEHSDEQTGGIRLEIEIEREALTLGDLRRMMQVAVQAKAEGDESVSPAHMLDLLDTLDRVVVGGVDGLPADALIPALEAVLGAIQPKKN